MEGLLSGDPVRSESTLVRPGFQRSSGDKGELGDLKRGGNKEEQEGVEKLEQPPDEIMAAFQRRAKRRSAKYDAIATVLSLPRTRGQQ